MTPRSGASPLTSSRGLAPPAEPRFPRLGPDAPHYESYFIKGRHPSEPRAFWMRHTVHQRPGEPRTASIWLTLFDAHATVPVVAGKQTTGPDGLSSPDGAYIRIGESTVEPRRAEGRIESPSLSCSYGFDIASEEAELQHLPIARMYEAKVPKTKSVTPHPGALFSGTLGDWELDDWVGVSSHNWGSEHAERWIYLHCGQFDGHGRDTWLEMTIGRIKLGPVTVPWIAQGALQIDGRRHRLGGPQRIRSTKIDDRATGVRLWTRGDGIALEGTIGAPREHFVAWRYADPEGPEHHSLHSSLCDVHMTVSRDGSPPLVLRAGQAGTYEIGMRETDHGIPVQPYDDGRL
jgi:hypothetical protein